MPKVTVKTDKKVYEINAKQDQNLLAILREADIEVSSPCNGNGTCGKCKVKVISENLPDPLPNEVDIIGTKAIEDGYRLSCSFTVQSDLEILLENDNVQAQIVTEGIGRSLMLEPIVTKENVLLEKPSLSNQLSDFERVMGSNLEVNAPDLQLIRSIPEIIRQKDYNISLIKTGNRLLGVEAGDTSNSLYGVAVDIGTTTIAAYLIDLTNGQRLCVHSGLNPQKKFGADVISRIKHTMDCETGLDEMHDLIINELNKCIGAMCEEANISKSNIYAVTLVGNTTMMHFLLKVPAKNIAAAPFIPGITSMLSIKAKDLGININPFGCAFILPSVSAYIGSDTVSAVLSTGMYEQEEISLLIDIGTNGEIVLGNKDALYSCSSAAGPAFEGANIRNGIGSVKGAINSISLAPGVSYTTIGGAKPIGICGTGIVDGIAQLLEVGIVDETGRLDDEWEPSTPELSSLAENIVTVDKMNAYKISEDIAITQKDICELQNAKGAIAAGINVLVKESGIDFSDIKNVYLAGGFGTYINVDSALKIGLIPACLRGKIQSVGNAAGQGAIEGLLSIKCLSDAEFISKKIKYIELSSSKDFNDYYMNCMMFE